MFRIMLRVSGIAIVVMMISRHGFAQENMQSPVISGVVYMEWEKDIHNANTAEAENSFAVTRVYLNFAKKFDDIWSMRITTDIGQVESQGQIENTPPQDVEAKSNTYSLYLKFAYVQAAQQFTSFGYSIRCGMVGTPLLNFVDEQSDSRWVQRNYFDNSYSLIKTDVDYSADLGVRADISLFNVVTLTGAVANGEGFKHVSETDDGKAYYVMGAVTPFKHVSLIAFDRYSVTDDNDRSDNYTNNSAFGVFYTHDVLRAGAVFALPVVVIEGNKTHYRMVDSYLHIDGASAGIVPVIVVGRFGYGTNVDDSITTKIYSGGIGYRFSRAVRVIAYYQHKEDDSLPEADKSFYIKCGVTF